MTKDAGNLQALKDLANELAARYADDPNILGVGWGRARRGGKLTTELSIVVYVRQKLGKDGCAARGTEVVPDRCGGYPTDIVVRGNITRAQYAGSRNDTLYNPLRGGIATSNLEQMDRTFFWAEYGVGTLGILCRDGEGRDMALSNWHVWADDGASNGDRIVQPATPDGGGYAEGIATTVLCGPVFGSLFEGRVPSPLAAGLYGGAAAAAGAAALSDEIDPFRRGQQATPAAQNGVTHKETLAVALAYENALPWPGRPFATQVRWDYTRHTNIGLMHADADEATENPQVLRGYAVAADRAAYEAGDTITVSAAIWDSQLRPADAYHVVAHLVSAADPDRYLRLVLHPARCRGINLVPPEKVEQGAPRAVGRGEDGDICVDFGFYAVDQVFEPAYNFGPVAAAYFDGAGPLRIAQLPGMGESGLFVPDSGVVFRHAPADRVMVQLAHGTDERMRIAAFDAFERMVAEQFVPAVPDTMHEITLRGDMITHVRVQGGDGRAIVDRYCFDPVSVAPRAAAPVPPLAAVPSIAVAPVLAIGRLHCETFAEIAAGTSFPAQHQFGDIRITALDQQRQRIVDWPASEPNSLLFSNQGILVEHAAAGRVVLRLGHFTGENVVIQALNAAGTVVQTVIKTSANSVETIELTGDGITSARITGGGHEAILVRYCFGDGDGGGGGGEESLVRCFRGSMPIPADAHSGRWIVYLSVQNVNHVPEGVPPETAATVIGGHVMGPTADALGCGFMLLGDHVFDIF